MTDLISRQDAIDAMKSISDSICEQQAIDALCELPSAQPTEASWWGCNCQKMERLKEQKTFSEMVHLHDAETHKERTETHACDCISRKEAIDAHYEYCNKHPDAGFPVWSLKILEDLPSAQPEPKWIPCSERLPKKPDGYPKCEIRRTYFLVTLESGCVKTLAYEFDRDEWQITGSPVIAWKPLPEPYAERRTDEADYRKE